ncbi:MAG: hypothetical protein WCP35_00160 [Verrucomicrobiota bacterium]
MKTTLSISACAAAGLILLGQALGSPADNTMPAESRRVVSQHKAVFNKIPLGLAPYSTDAILLGNGDIAMSISMPPGEKQSARKQRESGALRFWFHKNDMWSGGARSVALIDAVFDFDPAKPEPKCSASTDLYTAVTTGTLAQAGGVSVNFKIWVSAVDNMIFMEFVADNGTIPYKLNPQVLKELNRRTKTESGLAEVRDLKSGDGFFLHREVDKQTQAAASLCLRRFGPGKRTELDRNRQVFVIAIDSLAKNPNYVADVEKKLSEFDVASMPTRLEAHKKWWAGFWAESLVEIPDKVIERQYYLANYLFASSCRDKDFPPGILGSWFCTDGPGWGNDYHLNYNYQAAFYSLYASNHVAMGEVQDQPLLDFMPSARKLAKEQLNMPGILYPVGITPKGHGGGNTFNQKSNGAYGAVNMIFRWKTTHDSAYAKKVYPYFKELAEFWEAYMTFEKDKDRYVIANDSIHEKSGNDFNPIVSLALVRAVFATALEMSATLGVDQDKREKRNHILTHLSNYATRVVDGKTIFRYTETGTEYWPGNTLGIQHIYPALGIGLESSPELIKISYNTLDYMQRWFDNNGDTSFFPATAWLGYHPEVIYAKLHEFVDTQYRPNGMRNNKHGIEKVATIPNTVNLMLCSVHQDVMRLFPAWPKSVDARFANLRQFGAFLVTSELKGGEVRFVAIHSEKGMPCTLVNPWPGRRVCVTRGDGKTETATGARFTLTTKADETLRLVPKP